MLLRTGIMTVCCYPSIDVWRKRNQSPMSPIVQRRKQSLCRPQPKKYKQLMKNLTRHKYLFNMNLTSTRTSSIHVGRLLISSNSENIMSNLKKNKTKYYEYPKNRKLHHVWNNLIDFILNAFWIFICSFSLSFVEFKQLIFLCNRKRPFLMHSIWAGVTSFYILIVFFSVQYLIEITHSKPR